MYTFQKSVVNYQREKKCLDDLKKAQKKATILEGELRRKKEEEIFAATERMNKKEGDIAKLL